MRTSSKVFRMPFVIYFLWITANVWFFGRKDTEGVIDAWYPDARNTENALTYNTKYYMRVYKAFLKSWFTYRQGRRYGLMSEQKDVTGT